MGVGEEDKEEEEEETDEPPLPEDVPSSPDADL
jgi:hypothetical protein